MDSRACAAGEDGGGVHEDLWDTLCMLRNSGMVLGLFLLQVAGALAPC